MQEILRVDIKLIINTALSQLYQPISVTTSNIMGRFIKMSLRVLYNLPQWDQQVIIFCLCFETQGSTSLAIVTSSTININS